MPADDSANSRWQSSGLLHDLVTGWVTTEIDRLRRGVGLHRPLLRRRHQERVLGKSSRSLMGDLVSFRSAVGSVR